MILSDKQIRELRSSIHPFSDRQVNPASYDLCLGYKLRRPRWRWRNPLARRVAWALLPKYNRDPKANPDAFWEPEQVFDTFTLWPGEFVLCSSLEFTAVPPNMSAILMSKSSTGRVGLEHLHAGWGDPGFQGQWTWELINVAPWPVVLTAGKPLMQLVFAQMSEAPVRPYGDGNGRYQGQSGPTAAREVQ
jgi:dCTP deaminase